MGVSNFTLHEVISGIKLKNTELIEIYKKCQKFKELSKKLNAYISVLSNDKLEKLIQTKRELVQKNVSNESLHALPISIKDNFCTKAFKTTCASKMLSNYNPTYNATLVEKVIQSNGILIGKTNMDEFSMGSTNVTSFYGPAINAWQSNELGKKNKNSDLVNNINEKYDDDFNIAGGSSGGSAVAVSTGSAFVFYLRISLMLHSRYVQVDFKQASVKVLHDLFPNAVVKDLLAGPDPRDLTSLPEPSKVCMDLFESFDRSVEPNKTNEIRIKIGIPRQYLEVLGLEPEIKEACLGLADKLANWKSASLCPESLYPANAKFPNKSGAKVGFSVESVDKLPHFDLGLPCYTILTACEIASNMARFDGLRYGVRHENMVETRMDGFNEVVKGRILAGNYFMSKGNKERYFEKAAKVRRLIRRDYDDVLLPFDLFLRNVREKRGDQNGVVDILLSPVTLSTAPNHMIYQTLDRDQLIHQDSLTVQANLAGLPAISIPAKLSDESGMPIGIQLMGPHFSEPMLLYVAKVIEEVRGFFPTLKILSEHS